MSRVFITTRQDPRRLTTPPHQIARQSYGERQRIHGAIQPMPREDDTPSWATIARAAVATALLLAFLWLAIPALAEWTVGAL